MNALPLNVTAWKGTYSTDPYFCNAVLKSAMLSAYLVTSVGRKVIVGGFEREDRSASAALVARSPKTMEAPASWRKRTVAAPMPFAPPKTGVSAPNIEGGDDGVASGGQCTGVGLLFLPGNVVRTRQDDNLPLQFAKL
jgi:hypothetical protein